MLVVIENYTITNGYTSNNWYLNIALPIFGILFITDILLGFTSKMMPQMNIFMVSLPLKIYLGLLLSLIFMRPLAEYMAVIIEQFLTKIATIF